MNTFLENEVLNLLRGVNITAPTTVYLALFSVDPGQSGALTNEISATNTGYTRQAITFGTPAANGSISNTADILFGQTGSAGYTVAAVGLMDSATIGAGNCLWHGNLAASKTLASGGDTFKISSGSLTISIS